MLSGSSSCNSSIGVMNVIEVNESGVILASREGDDGCRGVNSTPAWHWPQGRGRWVLLGVGAAEVELKQWRMKLKVAYGPKRDPQLEPQP